jgi:hypothetical protein
MYHSHDKHTDAHLASDLSVRGGTLEISGVLVHSHQR